MKKIENKKIPEKLLKKLASAKKNTTKIAILNQLSEILRNSDPEKAMKYVEEGLKIGEKIGYKKGIAECLLNIGNIYWGQGNYVKALKYYQKSLEIFEELGNKHGISKCLNGIGLVFWDQSNYPQALEYYHKSLKMNEELANERGIAKCLNNIGLIYWNQNNYELALKYYHKSLRMNEQANDKNEIAISLNNIGIIYGNQGDYQQALEYFHKSLEIRKELGDKSGIASSLNNIGFLYYQQGNYQQALKYYHKSLEIDKELGNYGGIANLSNNIGILYIQLGEMKDAINYLTKGLNLAKEIGALVQQKEAYEGLSEVYAKLRKYKKALEYYKLYKETNDKLFNQEKSKQIADMQVRYETEQKEKEAEIYRLKNVELAQAKEKIEKAHEELAEAYRQLEAISRTDPLTGLLNRRGFLERAIYEIHRYERSGKVFSIVIADIDNFKYFNDSAGHNCGDITLKEVAKIMRTTLRKQDSVGRWGGDEFILLLPETNLDGAFIVAEKLKKKIENLKIPYEGKIFSTTLSFGLSTIDKSFDIDKCIKKADDALYKAKKSGKNKVSK